MAASVESCTGKCCTIETKEYVKDSLCRSLGGKKYSGFEQNAAISSEKGLEWVG